MEFTHSKNSITLLSESGKTLAEVTFPDIDTNTVNVNHTFVDDSLRGQGIAGKLMEELVISLRNSNRRAVLNCSYAISWFEKHPQYKELICQK